jgi:glycine/D-amino acid oxidase-like deaminating enzyme
MNHDQTILDYAVIGGGFAGLHCAYRLAEAGFRVTVLERGARLMAEASHNNFARLHHGWHYPGSLETALECIPSALDFLQEFGDVLLKSAPGSPSPFQTGWCVLAPGSFTSQSVWLERAERMRRCYAEQLGAHRRNFGPPGEFFRVLDEHRWRHFLDPRQVVSVASTLEPFVDLAALTRRVVQAVEAHPRITVLTGHEVLAASDSAGGRKVRGVRLTVESDRRGVRELRAHRVLNASWVSRAPLDAGLGAPAGELTYRLKSFLKVRLPDELRALPSLLFVHGPFFTFTNCGDGTGLIDYAPVSNCGTARGRMPDAWRPMLRGELTKAQHDELVEPILDGAARFVPRMRDAKVLALRAGVLQHEGNADIFDPTTALHHRLGTGVKALSPRWLSLDTGKLSWIPSHAREVVRMSPKARTGRVVTSPLASSDFAQA